jgi:NTE family protein
MLNRKVEAALPVRVLDTGSDHDDPRAPEAGIALCLSGGGYRAMLFHLGALWRLNELGYLAKLARVSSVSGGSIEEARSGSAGASDQLGLRGV